MSLLNSDERLRDLQATRLLDSAPEEEFDRICRLILRLLDVPSALVSLVDAERQYFKSAVGLGGPLAGLRETPLSHSFCQHVVLDDGPLVVPDATQHPLLCDNPAIHAFGVRSYVGVPIRSPGGLTLGALCAIDGQPREWLAGDVATLEELAELVNAQIAMRLALAERTEAETILRKISTQVPGVIYQFRQRPDGSYCFPYASEGLRQIYCTAPEDVREDASPVFAVLHPEDIPEVVRTIELSAQELQPWQHEYRTRYPDGGIRWLRGDSVPQREEDGSILWHGFITDVTERRRTDERLRAALIEQQHTAAALRESNALLEGILASTSYLIISTDPDGIITKINAAGERALGYRLDELLGRHSPALWHDPGEVEARAQQLAQELGVALEPGFDVFVAKARLQDGPDENEWTFIRRDGTRFPVRLSVTCLRDEEQCIIGYLGVAADITAARQAVADKAQLDHKLAETARLESLGVLAGGIAHDFNNILTGVLGHASLLELDLPPGSRHLQAVAGIQTAALRAADLCKQMLAYSGKGRFLVRKTDLNAIVTDTTRLLEISISKDTVLRYHLAPALPAIEADETQLRQIIMNLVINASEAIGEQRGVVGIATGVAHIDADSIASMQLEPGLACGDYVWLEVSDNGTGMTRDTLARIFDPFYSTKFTGRGLGLAAVQGIVRGHKGGIKVYSEPGKGTTFRLLFPCIAGAADAPVAAAGNGSEWRGSGKVLVVDDEDTVRTVAARLLERAGFTVVTAADGSSGVERFRADPAGYAFVLLDLTMPHVDGEETFRQLRRIDAGVRVVLMSGFNHQEVISRFAGKGLAGFVPKPLDARALYAAARAAAEAG